MSNFPLQANPDMAKPFRHTRQSLLIMLFVTTLGLFGCSNHADIDGPAPKIGFKTLENATPLALDGIGKPVLVNFWSPSCPICLKKMPSLVELYEEYAPQGFELVAVAMPFDRPSDVVTLKEQGKWPFRVALDFEGTVGEAFGQVEVTPTSFLIDADGNYVKKYVGTFDMDKFKKRLDGLLVEPNSVKSAEVSS